MVFKDKTALPIVHSLGLKAPSVMVDEELSQGSHVALPSFDRERETYGTPKKVKSGDLAKYVTSNYDEAQSSAPGFVELQN